MSGLHLLRLLGKIRLGLEGYFALRIGLWIKERIRDLARKSLLHYFP